MKIWKVRRWIRVNVWKIYSFAQERNPEHWRSGVEPDLMKIIEELTSGATSHGMRYRILAFEISKLRIVIRRIVAEAKSHVDI